MRTPCGTLIPAADGSRTDITPETEPACEPRYRILSKNAALAARAVIRDAFVSLRRVSGKQRDMEGSPGIRSFPGVGTRLSLGRDALKTSVLRPQDAAVRCQGLMFRPDAHAGGTLPQRHQPLRAVPLDRAEGVPPVDRHEGDQGDCSHRVVMRLRGSYNNLRWLVCHIGVLHQSTCINLYQPLSAC